MIKTCSSNQLLRSLPVGREINPNLREILSAVSFSTMASISQSATAGFSSHPGGKLARNVQLLARQARVSLETQWPPVMEGRTPAANIWLPGSRGDRPELEKKYRKDTAASFAVPNISHEASHAAARVPPQLENWTHFHFIVSLLSVFFFFCRHNSPRSHKQVLNRLCNYFQKLNL